MRGIEPARALWVSALWLVAMGFAAFLLAVPAAAQTEPVTGEPKAGETVAASTPTESATESPGNEPGTGGIVVSPPPTEPAATEAAEEGQKPDEPESLPTEEPNNEGVAPGSVVVVVWTSDGGVSSDQTTVCVSEICQPVGSISSGSKVDFERAAQGWHDVSVTGAVPYADAFASVSVAPGQRSTVEVTLTRAAREEVVTPTPPPGSNGPIRSPIQVVDEGGAAGRESSARYTANVPGSEDRSLRINALPATGAGDGEQAVPTVAVALVTALALAGFAALARRRVA